jgi:hypothetical protein
MHPEGIATWFFSEIKHGQRCFNSNRPDCNAKKKPCKALVDGNTLLAAPQTAPEAAPKPTVHSHSRWVFPGFV